jgi:hypothetical protein
VHVGPKHRLPPSQAKAFVEQAFGRGLAQDLIQKDIGAVHGLVAAHPAPRHVIICLAPAMDMGAFHRFPRGILVIGTVDTSPIVDPISDWHRAMLSWP